MPQHETTNPPPIPPVELSNRIRDLDDDDLHMYIRQNAMKSFGVEPKELQINTVKSLVKKRHTFVLAGTGFGKSRIAEMYFNLFDRSDKPLFLVLNPLDALGDNQVYLSFHFNIL